MPLGKHKALDHADSRKEAWDKAEEYAAMLVNLGLQKEWRVGVEPNPAGGYTIYMGHVEGEGE